MRSSLLRICCIILFISAAAPAADWFRLGSTEFSSRLPITIENSSETDNPAVFVSLPISELGEAMPEATAKTIVVADDRHQLLPFQISTIEKDQLIFVLPVKSHETRTVYVYAAKAPVQVPKFEPLTSTDTREAYRSFENEFTAFRVEVGDKAKTTGLAIDLFGKTTDGRGVQLKKIYASNYHERQPWGIDIMKVGTGPGLGGAYILLGEKLGRTASPTTEYKVLYEGPVASCVQASGPAEVDGKKFTITRTIKVVAGDRALMDQVEVKGEDAGAVKDLKIGLGLRDLPGGTYAEKGDDGYAFVAGDGNQAGTDKLGLGVAFDSKDFDRIQALEDKANGGHIYVLTPAKSREGVASISDRLLAYWNDDGWIRDPETFENAMKQYAELSKSPPKITIAKEAEKR